MNGFLKRDWSLVCINLKFYLCFVLCFAVLAAFTDFSASFASLYLAVFAATCIMGLFSYDETNRWEGYAAAAPNGRKAMVDARYLLSMGIGGAVFVLQLILGLLSGEGQLTTVLLYGGSFFLYAAIVLPVAYRFGGTKMRFIMVAVIAVLAGLVALAGTIFTVTDRFGSLNPSGVLPALFPLCSAVILALSHRVSRRIMAKKEL